MRISVDDEGTNVLESEQPEGTLGKSMSAPFAMRSVTTDLGKKSGASSIMFFANGVIESTQLDFNN